jgi:hypothetical protein
LNEASQSAEPWHGALRSDLDELVAFDAMRAFLENWWRRSGSPDHSVFEEGDVLWLLSACDRDVWKNGMPSDPAMWADWREAVARARLGASQSGG